MKTREERIEIARTHAAAEGRNDLATTLATLEAEPVYELQPVGRVLRLVAGFELRGEWLNDEGVGQEYVITLRPPEGGVERHHVIGILTFGESALSGERLYASERLLRLMFGPVYDETEPL